MQKNKITLKWGIVTGALLVAGLLLFLRGKAEEKPFQNLKPSQLDFAKSNQIKRTDLSETTPDAQPENKAILPAGLSENSRNTWSILEQILQAKNDNDPRLDTDLRSLNSEIHEALYQRYESLQSENRNGRGLIAFLIARDLNSVADAEFLKKIYQESPCTSFENCKVVAADDSHFSGINQTSLNYPQLAGLYQIEAKLNNQPEILENPVLKDQIVSILQQAVNFPVPAVQKKAEEIIEQFEL